MLIFQFADCKRLPQVYASDPPIEDSSSESRVSSTAGVQLLEVGKLQMA